MAGNKVKVLIVEDDQFLSKMYPTKMEIEGFESAVALDGVEAISKYDEFQPDIILLDIMLPNKNGFDVLQELKVKRNVKTPIIVMSNLGQKKDVEEAMGLGAKAYYVKAYTELNDLVNGMYKVLGKKKPQFKPVDKE